jgi:hypothetical protein
MLSLDLVTYVISILHIERHGPHKKTGMKSGAPESLTCDSRRVSVNEANTNSYGNHGEYQYT